MQAARPFHKDKPHAARIKKERDSTHLKFECGLFLFLLLTQVQASLFGKRNAFRRSRQGEIDNRRPTGSHGDDAILGNLTPVDRPGGVNGVLMRDAGSQRRRVVKTIRAGRAGLLAVEEDRRLRAGEQYAHAAGIVVGVRVDLAEIRRLPVVLRVVLVDGRAVAIRRSVAATAIIAVAAVITASAAITAAITAAVAAAITAAVAAIAAAIIAETAVTETEAAIAETAIAEAAVTKAAITETAVAAIAAVAVAAVTIATMTIAAVAAAMSATAVPATAVPATAVPATATASRINGRAGRQE
jgi:hypothetical protein